MPMSASNLVLDGIAVGMPITGHPYRTDPDRPDSGIRLLPRVECGPRRNARALGERHRGLRCDLSNEIGNLFAWGHAMDGRPQALDALDWPICATAVRMILQGPFSRDTPRRGINRPALVGRRRGVSRARRRKAAPARVRWRARSIPTGRKKGRNLALLETAEGQGFGCVLDGVHAVSGGDGAHDGAQCNAGVGLGKAGVFVALVPLLAPAALQRLPR